VPRPDTSPGRNEGDNPHQFLVLDLGFPITDNRIKNSDETRFLHLSFLQSKIGNPKSFDHPVCSRQHIRRNCESDLLAGFRIDDCYLIT
jgi:hypothetical protein